MKLYSKQQKKTILKLTIEKNQQRKNKSGQLVNENFFLVTLMLYAPLIIKMVIK